MVAKWLIILGVIFIVLGLLWHYVPWTLNWFGKLPGDIYIKQEHGGIYIPIVSMLIISVVLTIIINLFKRF